MDDYKTYYRKDLIPIITRKAMDLMEEPIISGKKPDGTFLTLAEVSHQNSLHSMYNSGIRTLARELIRELKEERDGEE